MIIMKTYNSRNDMILMYSRLINTKILMANLIKNSHDNLA